MNAHERVLVVCTGNSCRSIMAEALINHFGAGRFRAFSAGSLPTGQVDSRALEVLERHGIDCSGARSKSWDEFSGQPFDLVITVCDSAAQEACPAFAGRCARLHWSTPDPAQARGTADDIDRAFERVFLALKERVVKVLL